MLDKILVFVALVALTVFLGVVVGFVAEPDLVIVTALIIALASHDFYISLFKSENASKPRVGVPLESLPTGVSGKPATRKKSPAKKKKKTRAGKPAKGKK